ncbi:MAG: hypothetical protein ACI305_00820 [Lepagella sp.]
MVVLPVFLLLVLALASLAAPLFLACARDEAVLKKLENAVAALAEAADELESDEIAETAAEIGLDDSEALRDAFLAKVLETADTQRCMFNKGQQFSYGGFAFALDTRCKWDWWLPLYGFGGDLKTCAASTQKEFEDAIDFFDWDRSRAWYMDIAHSDCDFIYAISKRNCNVFTTRIRRDDLVYLRGRDKYRELAFQYWCLAL